MAAAAPTSGLSGPVSSAFEPVMTSNPPATADRQQDLLRVRRVRLPDARICPVCLGMPGALPVSNPRAVSSAVRQHHALTYTSTVDLARETTSTANLPRVIGSQSRHRLAARGVDEERGSAGASASPHPRGRGTGKSRGYADSEPAPHLDFNRSGAAAHQRNSERADLRSAARRRESFSAARAVLSAIGVNDGDMEGGSLRCDADVNPAARRQESSACKISLKNLRSDPPRAARHRVRVERPAGVLSCSLVITRRAGLRTPGRTMSMRGKEEAHRLPVSEPDLPPLTLSDPDREMRSSAPELPIAPAGSSSRCTTACR